MKTVIRLFTGFGIISQMSLAQASQILDENFLSRLRAEASHAHPSAIAGKQRAAASGHDVRAVRLWDDPMAAWASWPPTP